MQILEQPVSYKLLHFASFVSFRLVTNLNPSIQVVPVGNTWVRANCSAHDDLRPVKMYLMNVANE